MRKGATIPLLAVILLLAAVRGIGMGACDAQYRLMTPDGWTLDFAGPRFAPGTVDSLMAHDGFGLPPLEHVVQEIWGMDGAVHKDTLVKPRVVTITLTTHGLTRKSLHQARAKLMDAMRWNRGQTKPQPSILRYTVDGVSRDLYVVYDDAVRQTVGRYGNQEIIGFRLIAYDPLIYDATIQEQVLDWQDSLTVLYVAAREDGTWNAMGPPAAVAAGIVTVDIYAIAVDPFTGDIYFGGDFTNWDNIPNADFLVRWVRATSTWEAVGDNGAGGPALNERVHALHFGPSRALYVGGRFTNAGGVPTADYIAQVNVATDVWADVGGGPGAGAVTVVNDILVGGDMTVYATGSFTNWAGLGSPAGDYIVQLPSGGAWATVGNGLDALGNCLAERADGHVIVGGAFGNAGAVVCNNVADWDPINTVWSDLDGGVPGGGTAVYDVAFTPAGLMIAVGNIPTIGSGPTTVSNIASWNGVCWSACGDGLNFPAYGVVVATDGTAYLTGAFTTAGELTVDRMARWTGAAYGYLDIDIPDTPAFGNLYAAPGLGANDELYLGFRNNGTALIAGANPVVNAGNAMSYPVIEIKNRGYLRTIINESTGHELLCTMQIQDGEIVTMNLGWGIKTCQSTWRGNRLGAILPDADLGTFCLESGPRAAYGGVDGVNLLTMLVTDADPRELGDDNAQLSGWEDITGISQDNTDLGRLYVEIVAAGGGFYHVDLYMDAGLTELVGHTGSYNGVGAQAITADNGSGLGGTVTVDAVVGADADIVVWFTIATLFWQSRWCDMDNALE